MRNIVAIIGVVVFLMVGQAWSSQVTDISLQYHDGYTVARISVDGTVRFSHQTEEAKDGKPFRVIVDVLSAVHQLPAKNFMSLPDCPVEHIRTSQYAVKPEKVVRVVFDMEAETVYRVESDDNSISVFFPDKKRREFAGWTASAVVLAAKQNQPQAPTMPEPKEATKAEAKKTVAAINKEIAEDRLSSLSGSSPTVAKAPGKPKKATPAATPKPAQKSSAIRVAKVEQASSKTKKTPKVTIVSTPPKVTVPSVVPDVPYGPQVDPSLLEPPEQEAPLVVSTPEKAPAPKVATTAKAPVQKVKSEPPAPKTKVATTAETPKKKSQPAPSVQQKKASGKQLAVAPKATKDTPATKVTEKPKVKPEKKQQPKPSTPAEKGKTTQEKHLKPSPPTVAKETEDKAKTPQPSAKVKKAATPSPPTTSQPKLAMAPSDKGVKGKTDVKAKATPKATQKKQSDTKKTKAATKTSQPKQGNAKKKKESSGQVDSSATVKQQPPKTKKKSTARFRRSPTRPTKIKGTLVAEFPKRLVIKYKAQGYRDPFETLINDAKTYNDPIEGRIPNVEGLRLVGVLESETGGNAALLEDADGYGYILKEGDKVQKGYVLRIEPDRVYFQIFEYGWSRTVALNMD
jgi:hypothetical protein